MTEQEIANITARLQPMAVGWVNFWFHDHRDQEELEGIALSVLPDIIPVALSYIQNERSLPALVRSAVYNRLIDHFRRDNRPIPFDMSGLPAPSDKVLFSVRLDRATADKLGALKSSLNRSEARDFDDSEVLRFVIDEGLSQIVKFMHDSRGQSVGRR